MDDEVDASRAPQRQLRVPDSLSDDARQGLLRKYDEDRTPWPAPEDLDAWRTHIAKRVAAQEAKIPDGGVAAMMELAQVDLETRTVDGVVVHIATPRGLDASDRRVILSLHAGGWSQLGGVLTQTMGIANAAALGVRSWWVDYRMLPDHPFPIPLDDCFTVYRALLRESEPEDVVVSGTSAGGNLAAALILRARDEGLPMPAGAVLWTPVVDLTHDGDSWHTNDGVDPQLGPHTSTIAQYYARGHDLRDPYLSPLFGDLTTGFPPTILVTGTRDALLSDTVRFHRELRRAGVAAELHVFEAMPHTGYSGHSPEDAERNQEIRRFVEERIGTGH